MKSCAKNSKPRFKNMIVVLLIALLQLSVIWGNSSVVFAYQTVPAGDGNEAMDIFEDGNSINGDLTALTGNQREDADCIEDPEMYEFSHPEVDEADLYYENFDVTAQDMVDVACSYNGMSKYDIDGIPIGPDWCVYFVMKCARDLGISLGSTPKVTDFCQQTINEDRGIFYGIEKYSMDDNYNYQAVSRSSFEPREGDLVCFAWSGNTDNRYDHIGIVVDVTNTTMVYIDGNSSVYSYNLVGTHTVQWTSYTPIKGYLRPNYSDAQNNSLPEKCIDSVSNNGNGTISVSGWVFDPQNTSNAITVHVYVGGPAGSANVDGHNIGEANVYRPDVNSIYGCGDYHGFTVTFSTPLRGNQPVYFYAMGTSVGNYLMNEEPEYVNITNAFRIDFQSESVSVKKDSTIDIPVLFGGDGINTLGYSFSDNNIAEYVDCTIDWNTPKAVFTIKGKTEGITTFTVYLMDSNGKTLYSKNIKVEVLSNTTGYSISFNQDSVKVQKGSTVQLQLSFSGNGVQSFGYNWTNQQIAEIIGADINFNTRTCILPIKGISVGSDVYIISMLDSAGNVLYRKSIKVTVTDTSSTCSISYDHDDITMLANTAYSLPFTFNGVGISYINYSVGDESIASVSWDSIDISTGKGKIKINGLKDGKTKLTLSMYDDENILLCSKSANITCYSYDICASEHALTLDLGDTVVVNITNKTYDILDIHEFTYDNTGIVSVTKKDGSPKSGSTNYLFKADAVGTCKVGVRILDTNGMPMKYDYIDVIVKEPDPVGYAEVTNNKNGSITVKGCAYYQNNLNNIIDIEIVVGGHIGDANVDKIYVGKANGIYQGNNTAMDYPENHGFSKTITTSKRGSQLVCVYAVDPNDLSNAILLNALYVDITDVPAKSIKLTFCPENGMASSIITAVEGQEQEYPEDPSKEGFIFQGWFLGKEGTGELLTRYAYNSLISDGKDANVYAYWIKKTDSNVKVSFLKPTVFVTVGEPAYLSTAVTSTDQVTLEWTTSNYQIVSVIDGSIKGISPGSATITVRISGTDSFDTCKVYVEDTKAVYYETVFNYDVEGFVNTAYRIKKGDPYILPDEPSRLGYSFAGWYTGKGKTGDRITENNEVNADITLYAGWTEKQGHNYSISYDLDGGRFVGVTNPTAYTKDSETFYLNNPERSGYTFGGWTGTDLTSPTITVCIEKGSVGDRSYKAIWVENKTNNDKEENTSVENNEDNKEHKHKLKKHSKIDPTENADGSIEYWECEDKSCGKLFSDEDGTKEITLAETIMPRLLDPLVALVESAPVSVSDTINNKAVKISSTATYAKAVIWTGSKPTKEQLANVLNGNEIAQVSITGLTDAISMKSSTDPLKLIKISYKIVGKNVGKNSAYFTVSLKLDNKAVKKAKISKKDKRELARIVGEFNEKLSADKHYFDILPINLDDEDVTVRIKSTFKGKKIQVNDDGTIKKLKSVTVRVKIPAGKNKKRIMSYTYKTLYAKDMFRITISDPALKMATIEVTPANNVFTGTRTGVPVKKK